MNRKNMVVNSSFSNVSNNGSQFSDNEADKSSHVYKHSNLKPGAHNQFMKKSPRNISGSETKKYQ